MNYWDTLDPFGGVLTLLTTAPAYTAVILLLLRTAWGWVMLPKNNRLLSLRKIFGVPYNSHPSGEL